MKAGVPSLMHMKKYFPHVPEAALLGLMEKEVDRIEYEPFNACWG